MKSEIITIEHFHASKLNNERNIYVYLPPSYHTNQCKRYPVLYMHDGQYAFEKSENTGGSWNAGGVVDRLIKEGKMQEIIIVAVPNRGSERGSEYAHEPISITRDLNMECRGLLYEDFIVYDLKPYIDMHFRTLSDRENTALMGSSMGGLVTYNIGFRNPHIFGKLAMLSPFLASVDRHTMKKTPNYKLFSGENPLKLWLDIGEYEGFILADHVLDFADAMIRRGLVPGKSMAFYHVPEAAHFEADWAERLHAPFIFFFGDIGRKKSVKLLGRKTAGLAGMITRINTVVEYDSGFIMSDLNGSYVSSDPSVLEVKPDGALMPKKEGSAKITYRSDGIETSAEYTVVPELSDMVEISVTAKVPENTEESEPVTMNEFRLHKVKTGLYAGKFVIPRDSAFAFKFAQGDSFVNPVVEQDSFHQDIPYRRFKAAENMNLHYIVESWKGKI